MTILMIDGCKSVLHNKYYFWYCSIISNRLIIPVPPDKYCETHHILPVSLGGDNSRENLVKLTSREHYIVHCLLVKFLVGSDRHKMLYAINAMSMRSPSTNERYVNSKLYAHLKHELSEVTSYRMKLLFSDPEYKLRHSNNIRLSWLDGTRDKQLALMQTNSPFKIKEIHEKTIATRTERGTNVWITNNPMRDPIKKQKKVEQTSGSNHYLRKYRKYYINFGLVWQEIDTTHGLEHGLTLLGVSYSMFMKMLNGYIPSRGKMVGVRVKREKLNENSED